MWLSVDLDFSFHSVHPRSAQELIDLDQGGERPHQISDIAACMFLAGRLHTLTALSGARAWDLSVWTRSSPLLQTIGTCTVPCMYLQLTCTMSETTNGESVCGLMG